MNKRFSTLLASVLLAGSCFSAFALNSNTGFDAKKYYQLKAYTDNQGTVIDAQENLLAMIPTKNGLKDSLAVIKPASYEEFNLTLWKPSFEKKTNAVGQVYYEITLENKAGQKLIISKENVQAGQSFYKAQPAYIGTTGISTLAKNATTLEIDDEGNITFKSIVEASTLVYDATAKKTYEYAVVAKDKALKIMMAESKVVPNEGKIISLDLVEPTTSYSLLTKDLNADVNDSFELAFSNDVKANVFANPFTANKLRAVSFSAMHTAATNTSTFKTDLATAKEATNKAFKELNDAMGAVETEVNTAINYAKNSGIAATTKLGAGVPNAKDIESAINELDQVKKAYFANKNDGSTVRDSLDAAFVKLKALADTTFDIAGKLPANSVLLKAYTDAAANTKSLFEKVKKETNRTYAVVDSTMNAALFSKIYLISADDYPTGKETSVANKLYKNNLKTGAALVFDQFTTGTTVDIQSLLTAVYNAASKTNFVASADILSATPGSNVTSFKKAAGFYAIAIVDSLIDGKQAYLAVDTNYVAEKEQYFTYKADTLHFTNAAKTEVVTSLGSNMNLFAYQLTVDPSNIAGDEVTIKTFMPTATVAGEWYNEGIAPVEAVVVIRSLANNAHREVSVAAADDASTKNTTITFKQIEGPKPSFKVGEVYFVKSLKKDDAKKPYYVMTSTTGNSVVKMNAKYNNVPATQWFVSAVNEKEGKYTMVNRDSTVNLFADKKVIVLDAAANKMLVVGQTGVDTIQIEKLSADVDKRMGYKYVNPETYKYIKYTLSASNFVNPEAKVYLTMNADSAVVATKDVDKALILEVTKAAANNLADSRLNAESYKVSAYLGNDTLYFDGTKDLMLTKVAKANTLKLRLSNDNNQYELLWNDNKENLGSQKIGIEQDGNVVIVGKSEVTGWAFALDAAATETYLKVAGAPKNVTISLKGDEASKVTSVKPFAVIKRTGLDLKAAATDNDFVLGLDTAYVNRADNFRYAYYITKPIDTAKVGSFDEKLYMVSYADSTSNDKVQYKQDGLVRVGFVAANRAVAFNHDSLSITKVGKCDTINIVNKKGISNATWAFPIDEDNEGYYRIEVAPAANKADKNYISYLNGVLVLGNKEQAQLFAINDTDLTPTDNETVATSSIKVVAGEGNVTIAGAQGKKVVVTNVLGQVIANTVITSDDATIAASAGVVVVAVEGEAAVKAIVK